MFSPVASALTRASLERPPWREEGKKAEHGAPANPFEGLGLWVARGEDENGKALREAIDTGFMDICTESRVQSERIDGGREEKVAYMKRVEMARDGCG